MTTQISPFKATMLCQPTETVTGTEQTIAGIFGFLTAGPAGYIASVATIRGTKGSWFPWFALGIVAAPVLFWTQVLVVSSVLASFPSSSSTTQQQYR